MIRARLSTTLAAAATAAVLLLAGCSDPEPDAGPAPEPSRTLGGSVAVAEANDFTSFNPQSVSGNNVANARIAYATHSGFNYVDNNLDIVKLEDFGRYEKTSDDPLTVKYTVNEGVQWSDGEPVDADDMMLAWAAFSGWFDDGDTRYFDFAGSTEALASTDLPEIGDDNRSITLTWSEPYADWETAFGSLTDWGGIGMPAHIVARKAGLADDEALTRLIRETPRGSGEDEELRAVADFWNTGFSMDTLPADPSLYLSNGPFIVHSMADDGTLTLVRNDDYDWGPEPALDEITVHFIADPAAQVEALRSGEVDIVSPLPDSGTVTALQALDNVTVQQGNQLSYDHLDLKFNGVFADRSVREAFLLTVPRAEIVEAVLGGVDPAARPLDSQVFLPDQPGYEAAAAENGSDEFAEPDLDRARGLLDGDTPEVRILYNADNPNRAEAFRLIADSAAEAGFQVVDGGLPGDRWAQALEEGNYDAALFGWTSTGVGTAAVAQVFGTGSPSNYNGFSSAAADGLMDKLRLAGDAEEQEALQIEIDALIWEARYGLPLFQMPGVDAFADTVRNVEYMPNELGPWWNLWEWNVSS